MEEYYREAKRQRTELAHATEGVCLAPAGSDDPQIVIQSSIKSEWDLEPIATAHASSHASRSEHIPPLQQPGAAGSTLQPPTPLAAQQRHAKPQEHTPAVAAVTADAATAAQAAAAAAAAVEVEQLQRRPAAVQPEEPPPKLSELCVLLHGSIPMLQRRLPIISKRLQQLGVALAPLNALNSLTNSSSSKAGGSSSSSAKVATGRSKPISNKLSSSSSSVESFQPTRITHIVLHAPSDDSSGGSGGSSTQAAASPLAAAAASIDQLLKQAKQLQQQQQQRQQQQQQQPPRLCHLVSDGWLDAVLAAGQYVPEQQYSLDYLIQPPGQHGNGGSSSSDGGSDLVQRRGTGPRFMPDLDPSPEAPMGRFAMWLGHWQPEFNHITTQVEFVLQAKYSVSESAQRGSNETVRAALKELADYEEAIGGSKGDPGVSNLNHEALTYAHAAAVVRGCSFPLSPGLSPSQLQRLLPFVGNFMSKILHQILTTGTCEQLQCFRQDLPVSNSRGELRPNTAGGATRALFTKLPGVGPIMAEKWFKAGFRSIESMLEAATAAESAAAAAGSQQPAAAAAHSSSGGSSSRFGQQNRESIFPLSREALHSLQYSHELLETMPRDDITEMKVEVLNTLAAVTNGITDGWVLQQVGGAIRGGAVHDADWLITNNKITDPKLLDGLVTRVYDHMVSNGRLVSQEEGFCRLQVGKLVGYKEKARKDLLEKTDRGNRHQLDHYDHIWGIYITHAGKRRRMDLIFVPPDCHSWVFAFIGWSGSKQYLRFMRTHAGNCGMFLNSHFLMREVLLKTPATATAAAAAAAAVIPPGSRLQQTLIQEAEPSSPQQQQQQASVATPDETCNGCTPATVDLQPTLAYVTAAAAAGSFKSVVLSVPDEVPPSDREGREWWPPGWTPAAAAAAAGSSAAEGARVRSDPHSTADDGSSSDSGDQRMLALNRARLSELVVGGVGSDRPVAREEDLFVLLGIPYRPPHERCC